VKSILQLNKEFNDYCNDNLSCDDGLLTCANKFLQEQKDKNEIVGFEINDDGIFVAPFQEPRMLNFTFTFE
jgi:hypothetical protein